MYYVYLLRSENSPGQTYVGSTSDLRKRLAEHNGGKSIHTNKFKPWNLVAYIALPEKHLAEEFERYPKKRIRSRVCEEAPTDRKWAEILKLLPDPPLFRRNSPPRVKGWAHKFRHTFATSLLQNGVSVEIVARPMGHSSAEVTRKHYDHWIAERQLEAEIAIERAWKLN